MRILVTGAAGAGTTTLGRAIAKRIDAAFIDADDWFWHPSDPPYRSQRAPEERLSGMLVALRSRKRAVVAGSIVGWGEELENAFTLIVYLWVESEIRVERLLRRETERFGKPLDGFLEWAAQYDEGRLPGRSRERHERWLAARRCPVLRIAGNVGIEEAEARVIDALPLPRLVAPAIEHADSYRALVREFVERKETLIPFTLGFPADPFDAFLEKLAACSRGDGIPQGFVPHSTFWLVHEGEVVGVSNVRHRLTEPLRRSGGNIGYGVRPGARRRGFARELLRLTLERARGLGLSEAWLTCAKANVASVRTLLANGAVFVSEEFIESRGEIVQRYRIPLVGTGNEAA